MAGSMAERRMQTLTCAAAGRVDLDARRKHVDAAARVAPLVQRVLHLRSEDDTTLRLLRE